MPPVRTQESREEQAKREVGQTEFAPGVRVFLFVLCLAVICGVPLIDQTAAWLARRTPGTPFPRPQAFDLVDAVPSRTEAIETLKRDGAFRAGYLMNATLLKGMVAYETALEDESRVAKWLLPPMQSLLVGRLGAGNEQAYCGRAPGFPPHPNGWLFYRPEVDYLTGPGFLDPKVLAARARRGDEWNPAPQPDPIQAILAFHEALAARGIALVLLPAPGKSMVYPDEFSGRMHGGPLENPSFAAFKRVLEAQGVFVCDTAPLLWAEKKPDQPMFLRCDTHWSPEGARVAAAELKRILHENKLLPERAPLGLTASEVVIENLGDIANMMNLPEDQTFYAPEQVALSQVHTADGALWKPAPDADILFLGDSYANIYSLAGMGWGESAGIVEQLSLLLDRPVDTILMNDNGAYATRRQLSRELAQGRDRLAGKKVVIYEFAARELAVGDWKLGLSLELGGANAPQPATPSGPAIVRGTIKDMAVPPEPGTVPYKDCLTALHLTQATANGAPLGSGEALVFVWGMRDNVWTDAAHYKPGQQVTLTLVPWAKAEAEVGSLNRVELSSEAALRMEPWWGELPGASATPAPQTPVPASETPAATSTEAPAPASESVPGRIAAQLEAAGGNVYQGLDGWLFFGPELRSVSVGPFWGENAARVSRAAQFQDPLPAIIDFHKQLAGAGIELLFMPVPAKASVYPDKLDASLDPAGPRLDAACAAFYDLLRVQGVQVVDLQPLFAAHRDEPEGPVYCKTDSHWSPRACTLAAAHIAGLLKDRPWLADIPKTPYESAPTDLEIDGDLRQYLKDATLPKETVHAEVIGTRGGAAITPTEPWGESPVLLLGDSHNLVFHGGGDMHAAGAGFPDQLARALGFPVDLVAVRGSGATPARMTLLRRRDNLAGKKVVIWCFTAREFTEATGGWRELPVIAPGK